MEENHNSITHGVQHPGIHRFASPKFDPSIVYKKVGRTQAHAQRRNNAVVLLYQATRQHVHYNSVLLALFFSCVFCWKPTSTYSFRTAAPVLYCLLHVVPSWRQNVITYMHYSLTLLSACVSISATEGCAVLAPCCKQGVSSVEMYVMIVMVILVQLMMMNLNKRLVGCRWLYTILLLLYH